MSTYISTSNIPDNTQVLYFKTLFVCIMIHKYMSVIQRPNNTIFVAFGSAMVITLSVHIAKEGRLSFTVKQYLKVGIS